jgi:hypothetical protein
VCEDVVLLEGRPNALEFAMEGFFHVVATEVEGLLKKKALQGEEWVGPKFATM